MIYQIIVFAPLLGFLIAGLAGYYLSLPVIQAYQNRRKGALKAKWAAIREKAAQKADAKNNQD